jgi:predicted  nucleic acid-binding Zn-ribbon protein
MAGQRNIYRIARTLLLALAALLAVGAVGSMFLGSRAVSQAKASAVDQARTIVENSLPLTLAPGDVSAPATDSKADLITAKITPVLLDPSAWDDVAIWSLDGTIVYSTDRSLIGQRPEEARSSVRDATESGTVSSEQHDGMLSVLVPLRFRNDGPISAAIQLARPDDVITAAGRPWRYNAILMTIGLIITLLVLYRVMRLSATSTTNASFSNFTRERVAPTPASSVQRPLELPSPGLREEADARRKAEERATAAEERLNVIQDQYRKTLEELHVTQRMLQERPAASGPDPETETRLLKAEGQARLVEGQLKAMSIERDKLARHIAEQAKAKGDKSDKVDPEIERRARQVEQEAIGLRAELEGAQTELSVTRRELDALKAQAARAQEIQEDLDNAHVEALHAREAAESAQSELARATSELDDVRNELRALRTEEQKASVFGEELRAARAELDSLKASHRAELIEREADLETRVRTAREEFQALLEETQSKAKRQLEEREEVLTTEAIAAVADLRRETAEREAELQRAAAEREAELQTKLAEREAELQHRLAERESELQEQISEQAMLLEQRLSQRESELTTRVAEVEAAASSTKSELDAANAELEQVRTQLQAARDEIEAASHDGSSRDEQVAKANEELVRSRTEIETLQHELAEIQRGRQGAENELQKASREREALERELVSASAEVQAELTRGVELSAKADAAEQELRAAREAASATEQELERLRAEQETLVSAFEDAKARHATEIAAATAAAAEKPDLEEVLRASQERLASQTEKLIEVEERAHSAERQFADSVVRLEEVEAELRHLQMEKALHDLQSERPAEEVTTVDATIPNVPLEDRRSSTPFTKELALDAKKSLSHILGLTQIMKYKKDSKDQAQLIKQLTAAARRLDHTVADLAEADSLAHGVVELTIKRTDLEALLKRVVDESGIGSDHDVRIDSQPLVVGVDSLRVEQVVAGLLRFCGDRTATGKAITVRLEPMKGGALVSVEDPEPSSDGSLSPVITRFVEMQGGWTKIENRDGGGSAFRVFLPDGGPSGEQTAALADDDTNDEEEPSAPGTLQIVVAEPAEQRSADSWAGSEEQLFVQELHRLHAED